MRDLNRRFLTSTQINLNDKMLQTQIYLFGEEFTIHDSLPQRIWKFTSRERLIAGKMAKQAITQVNDSTTIYAWFDPDFFYSIGPESYSGLPGAILRSEERRVGKESRSRGSLYQVKHKN